MANGLNDLPDAPDPGRILPTPNPRVVGFYRQESGFRTVITPESEGGEIADKDCPDIEIVDICGGGQTDQTGKKVLRLSEFACYPVGAFQTRDVYFVATPQSTRPVFLTSLIEVEGQDIKITVFTWDSDGNSFARVNIDWHCCVQLDISSAES